MFKINGIKIFTRIVSTLVELSAVSTAAAILRVFLLSAVNIPTPHAVLREAFFVASAAQ